MITHERRTALLVLMLFIYIASQWSRYSIVYLGNVPSPKCPASHKGDICFLGDDNLSNDVPLCPTYHCNTTACLNCQTCLNDHRADLKNLKYGTCLTHRQYGILVSYAYIGTFGITGLFAGKIADHFEKPYVISISCIIWSCFLFVQALSKDYSMLVISRLGMGFAQALLSPCVYSLIADLFAHNERAGANSVYSLGTYIGAGLSSLSLVLSESWGWHDTTMITCLFGLLCIIVFLFVAQPLIHWTSSDHYQHTEPLGYVETFRVLLQHRISMLLFVVAPMRFFGGLAIGMYLPVYFKLAFPDYGSIFSVLNAFIIAICGSFSAMLGGYLVDRYKHQEKGIAAIVSACGCFLAIFPFLGVVYAENFYVAIACLAMMYLVAEVWFGPTISMLQNFAPGKALATAVSILMCVAGVLGSVAPAVIGLLDDGTTETIRYWLAWFVGGSMLISTGIFMILASTLRAHHETESRAPLLAPRV